MVAVHCKSCFSLHTGGILNISKWPASNSYVSIISSSFSLPMFKILWEHCWILPKRVGGFPCAPCVAFPDQVYKLQPFYSWLCPSLFQSLLSLWKYKTVRKLSMPLALTLRKSESRSLWGVGLLWAMSMRSRMPACPPCPCFSPAAAGGRLVGWQFMEKRRAGGMCAGLSQGHADCLGTRAKASCGWEDRLIARGDGALCGEGGATPGQGLLFVFQVAWRHWDDGLLYLPPKRLYVSQPCCLRECSGSACVCNSASWQTSFLSCRQPPQRAGASEARVQLCPRSCSSTAC